MDYTTISADKIFDGNAFLQDGSALRVNEKGFILEILSSQAASTIENIKKYEGILLPGLVNAHCHLELSWMHNLIASEKGLCQFIQEVQRVRKNEIREQTIASAQRADKELYASGVSLVGDICNSDITFQIKANSPIFYHSFIELFGILKDEADEIVEKGHLLNVSLKNCMGKKAYGSSLSPHAPYSVSKKLFGGILNYNYKIGAAQSIHVHESQDELDFFLEKESCIENFLANIDRVPDDQSFKGIRPMDWALAHMSKCNKIVLVHNTVSTSKDIEKALAFSKMLWWCLCPKANLYIEKQLPALDVMLNSNLPICIGTDSLASNQSLNLIDELYTLQSHFPQLSLEMMLQWITKNGAEALDLFHQFGKIEVGRQPGICLIRKVDFQSLKLSSDSDSIRII
ncbi:MAG TPA: amidohydrolase family protein [Bacteroidia bacterium]|nr:amidohydrolase family protein [Bacteroidia bacterium]HNT79879.1 amidohydrolase family protein [Bacteroidia bacterium]